MVAVALRLAAAVAVALPPALSQTDWLMDYERTVGELAAAHPELHPFDAAAPGTGPHAQRREFPCEPLNSQRRAENVHELMPSDIAAVGALGDSVTAGFGARASSLIDLVIEARGASCDHAQQTSVARTPVFGRLLG